MDNRYRYLTEEELNKLMRFPWKGLVIGLALGLVIPLVLLTLVRILT